MEQQQLPEEQPGQVADGCVNCGRKDILPGYPTALCPDCRNYFIKYPIPASVKIFAGVVGALLVFALFTFPKNLSLRLHLERGLLAEKEKRFITAQREFKEVTNQLPYNKEALGHQLIASYYNEDFKSLFAVSQKIENMTFDESKLINKINDVVDRVNNYFPDDSLLKIIQPYLDKKEKVPDSVYKNYLVNHPRDIYPLFAYASAFYEKDNYKSCDSVLKALLEIDNEYIPALRLLSGSQREERLWDESIQNSYRIIRINKEAAFAYGLIARTYLKQKKDKEAVMMAQKGYEIDNNDPYAAATMVLAYHFSNQVQKRDEIIKKFKAQQDSSAAEYLQYAIDVINKKEKFRD